MAQHRNRCFWPSGEGVLQLLQVARVLTEELPWSEKVCARIIRTKRRGAGSSLFPMHRIAACMTVGSEADVTANEAPPQRKVATLCPLVF